MTDSRSLILMHNPLSDVLMQLWEILQLYSFESHWKNLTKDSTAGIQEDDCSCNDTTLKLTQTASQTDAELAFSC